MSNKLKSKSSLTARELQAQALIGKEVTKAMLLLQSHLKSFIDSPEIMQLKQGGPNIPYQYIESSIKILLENYNKGIKSQSETQEPIKDSYQHGMGGSTIS